jgi:branched-subunit amino acid aminotransferase/4-amino-4-deoxychorismate lyase
VNGRRLSPDGPHISGSDRGLTLADGAFETMRVHGGRVFRLDAHLARLTRALDALGITRPTDLGAAILDVLTAESADEASLRLTVTRGPSGAGVMPVPNVQPTVIVALNPRPQFSADMHEAGIRASVASGRRNERAMTAGLKTLGYTDAVLALLEARRAGAHDALFLDTDGHCSEATSSNLFACLEGTLVTPPLSCGALPGITRAVVLELAARFGLPAVERVLELGDLAGADEAFLTSTLRGLAPLVRVGPHAIGRGEPGPVTRRLADAYIGLVVRGTEPR